MAESGKARGDVDMKSNLTTLCYIENDDSYLMMHRVKKEKDINKDKWVGVGGHFEEGESPEECLLREVQEETGLTLTSWKLRGVITFATDVQQTEYMFLYTADGYTGEMTECNEGNLEWVKKSDVYDLPIWEGVRTTPVCFLLLWQEILLAVSLALFKAGSSIPASMAMMAITTNSSISVNAD